MIGKSYADKVQIDLRYIYNPSKWPDQIKVLMVIKSFDKEQIQALKLSREVREDLTPLLQPRFVSTGFPYPFAAIADADILNDLLSLPDRINVRQFYKHTYLRQ
jgi:hypothetical protein